MRFHAINLFLVATTLLDGVSASIKTLYKTKTDCFTLVTNHPLNGRVPTKTKVIHSTSHGQIDDVYTPCVTVYGPEPTRTVIRASKKTVTTTDTHITGTYTSTSTVDAGTTVSTTVATTVVTVTVDGGPTTTTATAAKTVPTPSGFKPIQESLDDTTYQGSSKKRNVRRSLLQEARAMTLKRRGTSKAARRGGSPLYLNKYPKEVDCTKKIVTEYDTVSTSTAPAVTVTRTPKHTSTVTSTYVITSTRTECTRAKATSTVFQTTTQTTSLTETDTVTATTFTNIQTATSTQTTYAVCTDPTNYIGPRSSKQNGAYLAFDLSLNDVNVNQMSVPADTREDCCSYCASTPYCIFASYSGEASYCYTLENTDNTCPAGQSLGSIGYQSSDPGGNNQFINGVCGFFTGEHQRNS